jgi:outer membrane protein assembly factor BamB
MTAPLSRSRRRWAVAALCLVTLSACAEDDFIIPGEREDIRPPELVAAATDASLSEPEGARPISLPPQSVNASWAQSPGSPAYRTDHPALSAAPQLAWSVNIGAGDSRKQRITADPVVGGGRIYTLDASARVTAVSPDGSVIWSQDVRPVRDSEGDATGGGLAYDTGTLYVSSGFGEISALDAASGSVKWRQQLDATGSGSPLVVGDLVYLVAGDDTGWAIDTDNGRVAWQVDATPSVANVLGAPAPVLADGLTVFAFGSGDLIATFPQGGLRRWTASVAGQRPGRVQARISDITGAPVVAGDTLFAGNHSGRLVAFSTASGTRLWTAQEGAMRPVWPAGDSIFALTDRNELIRFDASDGQIIWRVELPDFLKDRPRRRDAQFAHHGPVLAGGRVIVTSSDGQMRLFAPEDGTLTATIPISGGATTGPVIAGGTLYVVSTNGQLLAYR